ncbi:MarR family winged helix-turn-helix transcriptional regulator [Ferrimonas pelagia]|uniref:HTH marR-type domain-containing protein n=1 Tax=Ferrimonas pelagia TaxID=1177826 RepID=A0ABP9FB98_9GAMM
MPKDLHNIHQDLMDLAFYFNNNCCQGDSCNEFSLLEFKALRYIERNPCCPVQAIGETLNISKSGATRLVNRMIKREIIERTICDEDARIRLLKISPCGQQCLNAVNQFQSERMSQLLARVEGIDACDVKKVLSALVKAI